jgi:hypothetical protein
VDVVGVQGREVGAMHAGSLDPGVYRLEWDPTDGDGHHSGSGDGRLVSPRRFVRLR